MLNNAPRMLPILNSQNIEYLGPPKTARNLQVSNIDNTRSPRAETMQLLEDGFNSSETSSEQDSVEIIIIHTK